MLPAALRASRATWQPSRKHGDSSLNSLQYGSMKYVSDYSTGPFIKFPHFGNSSFGQLPNELLSIFGDGYGQGHVYVLGASPQENHGFVFLQGAADDHVGVLDAA